MRLGKDRCFIIAEAGVNHDGDVARAEQLIDAAADAGADAIKFQVWVAGEQSGAFAEKADYIDQATPNDKSFVEILDELQLSFDEFRYLKDKADSRNIMFLATPDGTQSLDFIVDDLDAPLVKIASTEVTYPQFLTAIAAKGRPVLLSTGMSTLLEVEKAIVALKNGGADSITLLHCTTEYPAPADAMNLGAISTLQSAFQLPVGLSDHSLGIEAPLAAVALGVCAIEKHLTLSRTLPGCDHQASLEPQELRQMVQSVRLIEKMMGTGKKEPSPGEMKNIPVVRRSIVAARYIEPGTRLTCELLACKRPGTGIAPEFLDQVIGMSVVRALKEGKPVNWGDLKE